MNDFHCTNNLLCFYRETEINNEMKNLKVDYTLCHSASGFQISFVNTRQKQTNRDIRFRLNNLIMHYLEYEIAAIADEFMLPNFFSGLCLGKAMVAYTKPQQRKEEESEKLIGEEIRSSLLILDLKDGKL